MEEKAKELVMAAFVADSLALGVHWIYDPKLIESQFGRVESLLKPSPETFHKTKGRGEFTHYGDQMLVLLESVAAKGSFDLADFSLRWRKLFDGYDGYIDGATRNTLVNYSAGKLADAAGSGSDELAGAARIAPLVCLYRDDSESLVKSAIAQTQLTHTDSSTVESSEYFARVTHSVLKGATPIESMKSVAEEYFDISMVSAWLQKGMATIEYDSVEAIGIFGRSCHTGEMFPGVVHLIAKYENNLKEALVQCVMAGGDSAARGAMVGMVLGAHLGKYALPRQWVDEMKAREKIEKLLSIIA